MVTQNMLIIVTRRDQRGEEAERMRHLVIIDYPLHRQEKVGVHENSHAKVFYLAKCHRKSCDSEG